MGNRGILHDASRRLGAARWRHRSWICCQLSFKGRRRAVMAPRRYTELFFLDEATALGRPPALFRVPARGVPGVPDCMAARVPHRGLRRACHGSGSAPGAGRAAHAPPDPLRGGAGRSARWCVRSPRRGSFDSSPGLRRSPAALARLRLRFRAPPAGRNWLPRAHARAHRRGSRGRLRADTPSFGPSRNRLMARRSLERATRRGRREMAHRGHHGSAILGPQVAPVTLPVLHVVLRVRAHESKVLRRDLAHDLAGRAEDQ
jgi:hypothetical protein